MEHPWLFYALFFILGYVTCKTFYFFNSARKSLKLLQLSQVVSLFILASSMEHFQYSKTYRLNTMREENESEHNINAYLARHEEEVALFKARSIAGIVEIHGELFSSVITFEDWTGAMAYLEENKPLIVDFILRSQND